MLIVSDLVTEKGIPATHFLGKAVHFLGCKLKIAFVSHLA